MWAFFVALIGLVWYAVIKGNDAATTASADASYKAWKRNIESYNHMRIDEYDTTKDKIYNDAFNELKPDDLIDLLYDDIVYIVGKEKIDFYDIFQNPKNKSAMYVLWLSHVGKVARKLDGCGRRRWIEPIEGSDEYYYMIQNREEREKRFIRLLQRVEFNLRKQYPEFYFVFEELTAKMDVQRYGKRYLPMCDFMPFYRIYPSTPKRLLFRAWDDEVTNPDLINSEGKLENEKEINTVWIV